VTGRERRDGTNTGPHQREADGRGSGRRPRCEWPRRAGEKIPGGNEKRIPAGDGDPFSLGGERIPGSRRRADCGRSESGPDTFLTGHDGTGRNFKEPRTSVSGSSPVQQPLAPGVTCPKAVGHGTGRFRRVSTRPPRGRRHTVSSSPCGDGGPAPPPAAGLVPPYGLDRWDRRWDIFKKQNLSHLKSLRPNALRRNPRWDGTESQSEEEEVAYHQATKDTKKTTSKLGALGDLVVQKFGPLHLTGAGHRRDGTRDIFLNGRTLKNESRGRCSNLAPNSRRSESGCLARSGRRSRRPNRTAPVSG
jgi:hypothetical protein